MTVDNDTRLADVIARVKSEAREQMLKLGTEDVMAMISEVNGSYGFEKRFEMWHDYFGWLRDERRALPPLARPAPAGQIHIAIRGESDWRRVLTVCV